MVMIMSVVFLFTFKLSDTSMVDNPRPRILDVPRPRMVENPLPGMLDIPLPRMADIPPPRMVDIPQPRVVDIPLPRPICRDLEEPNRLSAIKRLREQEERRFEFLSLVPRGSVLKATPPLVGAVFDSFFSNTTSGMGIGLRILVWIRP